MNSLWAKWKKLFTYTYILWPYTCTYYWIAFATKSAIFSSSTFHNFVQLLLLLLRNEKIVLSFNFWPLSRIHSSLSSFSKAVEFCTVIHVRNVSSITGSIYHLSLHVLKKITVKIFFLIFKNCFYLTWWRTFVPNVITIHLKDTTYFSSQIPTIFFFSSTAWWHWRN